MGCFFGEVRWGGKHGKDAKTSSLQQGAGMSMVLSK